ncbi:hypothetical protein H6501_03430 [Candidatus Woesearchaeota archaeon]|nr:hypothetical protein [Nanoarchaeota archaeon]MCB9370621.1 hypothetical protein [Candidatus Woesearchaeota archaeon]USN43705.1 MAG: hypothetical protein H6500_04930 [Candidatus Woesearchaeota archaeon]
MVHAIKKVFSSFFQADREDAWESNRNRLLDYLSTLNSLESKLWGVRLEKIHNGEDLVLEDTHHLIYMLTHSSEEKVREVLSSKEFVEFLDDLQTLRKDFTQLRHEVKERDVLRNLISTYTIRLVEKEKYEKLQEIFLLVRQLNDVIDYQEEVLCEVLARVNALRFTVTEDEKVEVCLESLRRIRHLLSGQLEHHKLWAHAREEYSNTSNILHALITQISERF